MTLSLALAAYIVPVSSVCLSHAFRLSVTPPILHMSAPANSVKESQINDAASVVNESELIPAAFGVSSSLACDPDLMLAASEAADFAGLAETFTASQIVIAFNSWKLLLGRTHKSTEEEVMDLRAFAANAHLISTHLKAAESALIGVDTISGDVYDLAADELGASTDWIGVYNQAAATRESAAMQQSEAVAGRLAAEDKLRQALLLANQEEEGALTAAQVQRAQEVQEAEEIASRERARIAQALAQVAVDEKEQRQAAENRYAAVTREVLQRSGKSKAGAEADRRGALHKWMQAEERAAAAIKRAGMDMANALKQAKDQEDATRMAADKRASAVVAAQAEAQALLELLKQTKDEAAAMATKAQAEKEEMEKAVQMANRRAQKAKLAAQAALDEI
eukprot:CAMPEP_0119314308 /NCGR_PEP_ID=MMETSP1333-20130426/32348_1 /TAXON_ID=418940 /ORGANISM="Scyphosphaera apsteinii, Strain RCC1455" /LENGTH=393 /DNA_ID=CAMNT_0007319395 /DNA_START=26 /DNA_END=1207 /DNA_ORIENTATION=+